MASANRAELNVSVEFNALLPRRAIPDGRPGTVVRTAALAPATLTT
jgi:hypothetical protein